MRLAIASLGRKKAVTWEALRSVVPDEAAVVRCAARCWSQAGELHLTEIGSEICATTRRAALECGAAVAGILPEVVRLAAAGPGASPSISQAPSSSSEGHAPSLAA